MVKASSCTGQGHVVDPAIHIINKVKGEDRESPTPWMTYIYILFIIYIYFFNVGPWAKKILFGNQWKNYLEQLGDARCKNYESP